MYQRLLPLTRVAFLTALPLVFLGSVRAGDYNPCCNYKTITCYETVTTYETRQVPYTRTVTCYDECGRPYTESRVCYRTVRVPVARVISVTKRVPVCY